MSKRSFRNRGEALKKCSIKKNKKKTKKGEGEISCSGKFGSGKR